MLAVPLTGTGTGAPSARNSVPSAGLSIDTVSCAPFGSVVLFDPANAGSAVRKTTKATTTLRCARLEMVPLLLTVFPFELR
jgi:hypothetical protein